MGVASSCGATAAVVTKGKSVLRTNLNNDRTLALMWLRPLLRRVPRSGLVRLPAATMAVALVGATPSAQSPTPQPLVATGQTAAAASTPADASSTPAVVDRMAFVMGTTLTMSLAADDRQAALAASECALRAVEAVEQRLSTWRDDSELQALNRTPVGVPFLASVELADDLRRACQWAAATERAFDPCLGALVSLYDLRGDGRWPSAAALRLARARSGVGLLLRQGNALTRTADVRVEEGAFAKGSALDAAAAAALSAGALQATFDFGGQILVVGRATRTVSLADPQDRQRPVLRLALHSGSIATSGNGVRGRIVAGRPLGHVLDPRTGTPAEGFGSVTVWAQDAFAADCLSTACFVLGPDAALAFAERHDGVEAVVLQRRQGSDRLLGRVSSGLRNGVQPLVVDLAIQ